MKRKLSASSARIATEAQEQCALIQWVEVMKGRYPQLSKMFAIPNGGSRKGGKIEGAHLKRQGVKAGVADLFLPVARGPHHGLFIEMKRLRDWYTTDEQAAFNVDVTAEGYLYLICAGWEAAADRLLRYLALETL